MLVNCVQPGRAPISIGHITNSFKLDYLLILILCPAYSDCYSTCSARQGYFENTFELKAALIPEPLSHGSEGASAASRMLALQSAAKGPTFRDPTPPHHIPHPTCARNGTAWQQRRC